MDSAEVEAYWPRSRARLLAAPGVPAVFQGRGLGVEHLRVLELGLNETGDGVIALRDLGGRLVGLKLRRAGAHKHKYAELPPGNGNPPWFAPDAAGASAATHRGVLCVEGELNAMLTWLSLPGAGGASGSGASESWAVVGLGSTFGPVPWAWLEQLQLPLVFAVDPGRAGDKSVQGWLAHARTIQVPARRATPLLPGWDACDYAETCGLDALGHRWQQVLGEQRMVLP